MKTILTIVALALSLSANAQIKKEGNIFKSTKSGVAKDTIITKYYFENSTGKWQIILSSKGSAYYWCKTKSGKLQRRNCPHEVSESLAAEYKTGYVYKPRNKSK